MSAAAPQGFANLPSPLGPGSADPGGAQIYAFGGQIWALDSQGNTWQLNAPRGDVLPGDQGLLEWNFDPAAAASAGASPTTTAVTLARINVRTPTVVNNVWVHTASAFTVTANQNFVGIYSSAGALLGSSAAGAIDAKLNGAAGVVTQALQAPAALGPGFYWVAFLAAGTMGKLTVAANAVVNCNTGLSAAAYRFASNGTGSTLAASITPGSNSQGAAALPYWAGVS